MQIAILCLLNLLIVGQLLLFLYLFHFIRNELPLRMPIRIFNLPLNNTPRINFPEMPQRYTQQYVDKLTKERDDAYANLEMLIQNELDRDQLTIDELIKENDQCSSTK